MKAEFKGGNKNILVFKGEEYDLRGNLDLSGCTCLTSLPEGLKVGGNLDLSGCTGLTSLPEGLKVGGEIYR